MREGEERKRMTPKTAAFRERLREALQHSVFVQNGCEPIMQAAQALLSLLDSGEWVIAPREPSEETLRIGLAIMQSFGKPSNGLCNAYRSMVCNAAPDNWLEEILG